jgi:hypothetical protein
MKRTPKKCKDIPFHGLEESILLKCPYHPRQSGESMQSLPKKKKRKTSFTETARAILNKKSKSRGIILLDFQIHYKAIITEVAWFRNKNTQTHRPMKQNRKSRTKPRAICVKKTQWRKDILSINSTGLAE